MKQVLAPKILVWVVILLLYSAGVIAGFMLIGVWDRAFLKDMVLWLTFVGVALGFRAVTTAQDRRLFTRVLLDNVKIGSRVRS